MCRDQISSPQNFAVWQERKLNLARIRDQSILLYAIPSVTITSLVAQLLSFLLGCLLAHSLPLKTFKVFGEWDFTLNPDTHFNIKENAVITIMSNLSFGRLRYFSIQHWRGRMLTERIGYRYYPGAKGLL